MSSVLAKHALVPHPDAATPAIAVTARLSRYSQTVLQIDYAVTGDLTQIVIPQETVQQRGDRLWETTCFEGFLQYADGPGYIELNVAPSRQWALYVFSDYRCRAERVIHPSGLTIFTDRDGDSRLALTVMCDIEPVTRLKPTRLGLSAVIEAKDGTKSYWALRHPAGAPDFHHPDCFALKLPSQDAP